MTWIRWVHVATSGRRFRTYVGRLPGGRKLPGGARPIEQIVGFTATLSATIIATRVLPYNALTTFGCGVLIAIAITAGLSFIKYDGVPIWGKTARTIGLVFDRRPTVLAREELDRQVLANPHAFVIDDDPTNSDSPPAPTNSGST